MAAATRIKLAGLFVVIAAVVAGCVISTTTLGRKIPLPSDGAYIESAFRAHMRDGSVIVFPRGASFSKGLIDGTGTRFDVTRDTRSAATGVSIDSVVGLEVYERIVNPGRTAVYLPISFAASTVLTAVALIAIFGSCPTIYADSAGTSVLQAESFSYSIAPLLAKRDVDRLDVRPDSNGVIRLDVRNEALETHYIDQLELIEIRHRADELVVPAPRGSPVAIANIVAPSSAHDRAGRDVSRVIAHTDQSVFASSESLLASAASGGRTDDYLELTVPRAAGHDSLAVVLRMRASLLSTEVLYDHMLSRPGPRAIDWLASDLSSITTLARLATWYTDNFGLRVLVYDGADWKPVVRLMDFGPVAWRNVAAVVPALQRDSVRIRLAFTADEFRIDQAAIGWDVRRTIPRTISAKRVTVAGSRDLDDARSALARVGDKPLVTSPGQRFFADFDVGRSTSPRTFLVAASGYYTEWIRPKWIDGRHGDAFVGRIEMRDLIRSWLSARDSLEHRFFTARVPAL